MVQQFAQDLRPGIDWLVNQYRNNKITKTVANSGLIYAGMKILSAGIGTITGDESLDKAVDMAAPVITAAYVIRSNSTEGLTKDAINFATVTLASYDTSQEMMDYTAQEGMLHALFDYGQSTYSTIQDGLSNLGDKVESLEGFADKANERNGLIGGIIGGVAYIGIELRKGFHRARPTSRRRRRSR